MTPPPNLERPGQFGTKFSRFKLCFNRPSFTLWYPSAQFLGFFFFFQIHWKRCVYVCWKENVRPMWYRDQVAKGLCLPVFIHWFNKYLRYLYNSAVKKDRSLPSVTLGVRCKVLLTQNKSNRRKFYGFMPEDARGAVPGDEPNHVIPPPSLPKSRPFARTEQPQSCGGVCVCNNTAGLRARSPELLPTPSSWSLVRDPWGARENEFSPD